MEETKFIILLEIQNLIFPNDQNLLISEPPVSISIYFYKRNVFLPQFNSIQNQTNIFLFSFFFSK
jgi:hypothetical protein